MRLKKIMSKLRKIILRIVALVTKCQSSQFADLIIELMSMNAIGNKQIVKIEKTDVNVEIFI